MNYQDSMVYKATLERKHDEAANDLKSLVGNERGAFNLTPDSIKQTPEWKSAYQKERAAFNAMRDFNMHMARNFKKELRAERDAKRQAKLKGE